MIFHFLNATVIQHARFRVAVETCKANLLAVNCQCEIEWVDDPGPPGGDDLADTSVTFDGFNWKAKIRVGWALEDDPRGEPFYRESIIHELAHLLVMTQFSEENVARVCELYGRPASDWANGLLPWGERIQENLAELLKDAMLDRELRFYDRTERVAYDFPEGSWDELLDMFSHSFFPAGPEGYALASEGGELELVEATPSTVSGITRYFYKLRIINVPFYGQGHYYRGVLNVLDPSGGPLPGIDIILFRVDGRFAVKDGDVTPFPNFNFNAGARVPFNYGLAWFDAMGPLDYDLSNLNDSLWAWEKTPVEIELEVRFNLERPTAYHPRVTTTLELSNHPGFPFIPRLPYPTVEILLPPSSITAYPFPPGTRRTPRTVVGG